MTYGALVLQSPANIDETGLQAPVRDAILRELVANDAVRYLHDLEFGFCYPGGPLSGRPAAGNPANGAAIYDVAERGNSSFALISGDTVSFAGGGFDYSTCTHRGNRIIIPATVAADLWAAYTGKSQRYMMCHYVKLPTVENWYGATAINSFFSFAGANAAPGAADIVTVGQATGGNLQVIRQTNGATISTSNLVVPSGAYGQIAQISFRRTDSRSFLRLRWEGGTAELATALGPDNSTDFSARQGNTGLGSAYRGEPLGLSDLKGRNFREYRFWVANLARLTGTEDLVAILEADWLRFKNRVDAGKFS